MLVEPVLAAAPDLVVMPPWSDPAVGALIAHQGIPVHHVGTPSSLAEVREQIRQMGDVVGEQQRAEQVVGALDARLTAVAERARAHLRRPTVLLWSWSGHSPGEGTLFSELVRLAGGRCAAAEAGLSGYAPIPLERLLELDPDVLVLSRYRADGRARDVVPDPAPDDDSRLASLRAVREDHVLELPTAHLLATSHHVAALAEDLERALAGVR
jgi:iron complex transport system substrate-binding protein